MQCSGKVDQKKWSHNLCQSWEDLPYTSLYPTFVNSLTLAGAAALLSTLGDEVADDPALTGSSGAMPTMEDICLLYTSDAADD